MEFVPIVFLFLVVLGAVQGSPYLVEGKRHYEDNAIYMVSLWLSNAGHKYAIDITGCLEIIRKTRMHCRNSIDFLIVFEWPECLNYSSHEVRSVKRDQIVIAIFLPQASLFKCCNSSGAVAFEEEGAAITARTTAALALPAAATCGAPTADAKEQVSSSAGARSELSSSAHSSLIFSVSAFVRICDSLSSKYKCHL
ncbi:hypothetical protein CEXT_128551 [Caerostris extrusa]|uniref:Uncharacterized protein n=1 Tax=Caerostris extrusa TaxID=172846 RepID=A0AAV4XX33_CAEEX|nr:hypothetical protein CEXT_128551 [Caerostris extrusa]